MVETQSVEAIVVDARHRHEASGIDLRAEIEPGLQLDLRVDELEGTLDSLTRLIDFAYSSAPPESAIDLVLARPAQRLVRVGAAQLSLRWQVRADSRGDADRGAVVSLRPGIQNAESLRRSSAAGEIQALFESLGWRLSFEAVAETGEIWVRAECD